MTYLCTHTLARTSMCVFNADAICEKINQLAMSNGYTDSLSRMQADLDAEIDADTQALFEIRIVSED